MAKSQPDPGIVQSDIVEKVNAGAQLVYALWHCDKDTILALPDTVHRALARAQAAYGVGYARSADTRSVESIRVAEHTDPLKVVEG